MEHTKQELLTLCHNATKNCMATKGEMYFFSVPGSGITITYNRADKSVWVMKEYDIFTEYGVEKAVSNLQTGFTNEVLTKTEFEIMAKNSFRTYFDGNGGMQEILN